jgi:hypothetical protein
MPELNQLPSKANPDDTDLLPIQQANATGAKIAIGDLLAGVRSSIATLTAAMGDFIPLAQKGAANGVATLGADGKIPVAQISGSGGGGVGGLSPWTNITGNYTAQHGDRLRIDASSSDITITLPSSPSSGGADIWLQRLDTSARSVNLATGGVKVNAKNALSVTVPVGLGTVDLISYPNAAIGWLSQHNRLSIASYKALVGFNGNLDDDTGLNTWTGYGGAATSSVQSYEGGSSLLLDNAAKYVQSPWSSSLNFSGDFTWQCWIYPTTVSGTLRCIMGNALGASAGNAGLFVSITNGTLVFRHWLNDTTNATISGVQANVWQQIKAVRSGNVLSVYLNGVKGTDGATSGAAPSNPFTIGIVPNAGSFASNFLGYVDKVELF